MARNSDLIAQLLGEEGESTDHSLRAHSLKRATTASVPRTLTPYEWQQWYEEYGVPESHIRHPKPTGSWWRRLLGRSPKNPSN